MELARLIADDGLDGILMPVFSNSSSILLANSGTSLEMILRIIFLHVHEFEKNKTYAIAFSRYLFLMSYTSSYISALISLFRSSSLKSWLTLLKLLSLAPLDFDALSNFAS